MTLDELSKKWLVEQKERQIFNQHFYECAGKWFIFANEVIKAYKEKEGIE